MLYETSQINLENMTITFVHVAQMLLPLKQKRHNPSTETQIYVNFSKKHFIHIDDIIWHEKEKENGGKKGFHIL